MPGAWIAGPGREWTRLRAGASALARSGTILLGVDQAWHMAVQGGIVVATPADAPLLMTLVQADGDVLHRVDPSLLSAGFDREQRRSLRERHSRDIAAAIAPLGQAALGARDLAAGMGALHRSTTAGSGLYGVLSLPWSALSQATLASLAGSLFWPAVALAGSQAVILLRFAGGRLIRRRIAASFRSMQETTARDAAALQSR